jgi:hypothetical protein
MTAHTSSSVKGSSNAVSSALGTPKCMEIKSPGALEMSPKDVDVVVI